MANYLEPEDDGLSMRSSGTWAEQKLDYLARYIDVFEKSMRGKWPYRNYIDLMAGPGKDRIRGSRKVLLGSPLLALNAKYPFTNYFFVELDKKNSDALQQRCKTSPFGDRVNVLTGDCNNLIDSIIAKLKQTDERSLNLAFLDPEGFELEWVTVSKLAAMRRMDLIINYPEGGFNRYRNQASELEENTSIDEFFGDREWRRIYRERQSRQINSGLHRLLIDHYKEKLKTFGYTEVFRGDEIYESEPLMRNTKSAPLYRLLFASKHNLGYKFWQEVIRRDVYGKTRLPGF
jgi:three-Cys-motif partner protein